MGQTIKKIYLHWTATPYNWAEAGHYHTVVLGNGKVRRLTAYDQFLPEHTACRNQDSVGMAISCMGGDGWEDYPPTEIQIENLCKEVAQLAFKLGWKPDQITITRILTHAEAAANRDFSIERVKKVSGWRLPTSTPQADQYMERARALGLPHENYGPSSWFDGWPGGFVERWDLWQLKPNERKGEGGFILRDKIKKYLTKMTTPEIVIKPATPSPSNECKIYLDSTLIATGYVLSDNRCYVQLTKLTAALKISLRLNKDPVYINLLSEQFTPKYLADSPVIMGYRTVDIYMNRPEDEEGEAINDQKFPARPFMQGILIDNSTHVLLADFCNELKLTWVFQSSDRSIRITTTPPTPATNTKQK